MTRSQNFVFFTASGERAERLGQCLDGLGRVDRLSGDAAYITRSAVILKPTLAFVDFGGAEGNGTNLEPDAVVETLRRCLPEAVIVGVGDSSNPAMTLLALRSGVVDFIDLGAQSDIARAVVNRLTQKVNASSRRAITVAIAGARVGVGTSTLAAHLVTMLGETEDGPPKRLALIDLGLPVGDGLLYTNTVAGFDFADAVTALSRLDETLVRTALPVSPKGISILSLPADLTRMRTLPQADAVMLVDQIRKYFDVVVIDLGGAGSADLAASILSLADVRLMLTDQAVGSIVSLTDLLSQTDERSIDRASLKLLVNRYDESYGMAASQLSERFHVALAGTIPDRRLALGRAAALGQLLTGAKQDPYVRALQKLVENVVMPEEESAKSAPGPWSNVSRLWRGKRS